MRFDRNAIYLGAPVGEPVCPTRVVGRTEALHLTPLAAETASGERRAAGRKRLAHLVVPASPTREAEVLLPEAGVKITASYGSDRSLLQRMLRAGSVGYGRVVGTPAGPPERAKARARKAWTTGPGFDTCSAPTLSTMSAWRGAYAVANIYIGGAARGCAQYNLSKAWVRSVRRMGYRLIPTYVGLQAPCTGLGTRFKAASAGTEGVRAASDAVARARALGIPR
ncbi:MAG: glycoside hydrolase domain-containing protein, partial [Streptosporangiaceae bacterium]